MKSTILNKFWRRTWNWRRK